MSNGASVSPAVDLGLGYAVYGLSFPNLRDAVSIRFQAAESAAGTFRTVKPEGAGAQGSVIGVYTTAGSQAAAVSLPGLAPFRWVRIVTSATLTSARTFLWFAKA